MADPNLSVDEDKRTGSTWNYCSPRTQTICDFPPEILENIFQQMNSKDVKTCRLVCSDWNSEIKAHTPQALVVGKPPVPPTRTNNGNEISEWWRSFQEFGRSLLARFNFIATLPVPEIEETSHVGLINFVRQINKIKSLHLVEFSQELYACLLKEHQRKQLQRLKISCKLNQNFIQLVLQPCTNLKVLKISDVALNSCDFDKDWSSMVDNGNSMFLCNNLRELNLFKDWQDLVMRRDGTIDGKEVQLNSKNITFLLRHISSLRMKTIRIEFEPWLLRVSACIGRRAYRFEDMDLQTFICKNGMYLEELDLQIPLSMPKKCLVNCPKTSNLPISLKSLSLDISIGSDADHGLTFLNPELLQYDPSFYDSHLNETNFFLKTLSVAQTQLVKYQIELNCDPTPSFMENIYSVIQNNRNTLEQLFVFVRITDIRILGGIDGIHFEGTKLLALELWPAILAIQAAPILEDMYRFTNFHLLPKTITYLGLLDIKLDREDFVHLITNLTSLRSLRYLILRDIFDLGQIENFRPIVEGLVAQCTHLELGRFGNIEDERLLDLLNSFGSNYSTVGVVGGTGTLRIDNRPEVERWPYRTT